MMNANHDGASLSHGGTPKDDSSRSHKENVNREANASVSAQYRTFCTLGVELSSKRNSVHDTCAHSLSRRHSRTSTAVGTSHASFICQPSPTLSANRNSHNNNSTGYDNIGSASNRSISAVAYAKLNNTNSDNVSIRSGNDALLSCSTEGHAIVNAVDSESVCARRSTFCRSPAETPSWHTTPRVHNTAAATTREASLAIDVCSVYRHPSTGREQSALLGQCMSPQSTNDNNNTKIGNHSVEGCEHHRTCSHANCRNGNEDGNPVTHRALTTHSFSTVVMRWLAYARALSARQALWIALLVLLLGGGNVLQILMLNFWLQSFPKSSTTTSNTGETGVPGNYTVFAIPGIIYALLFGVVLLVYVILRRPHLGFARHRYGLWLLCGIGVLDTLNSWMSTYAATYTNEMLQVLFASLSPLYAVVMCKYILRDPRSYVNRYIVAVFVLTVVGVLPASLYGVLAKKQVNDSSSESEAIVNERGRQLWTFIFFASIPLRVLMNVWQTLYMIVYTEDCQFACWLSAAHSGKQRTDGKLVGSSSSISSSNLSKESQDTPSATKRQKEQRMSKNSVVTETHRSGMATTVLQCSHAANSGDPCMNTQCHTTHAIAIGRSSGQQEQYQHSHNSHIVGDYSNNPSARYGTNACEYGDEPHGCSTREIIPSLRSSSALVNHYITAARTHQGSDMAVKLVMLAGDTIAQACFTLALLPADALPWWGNSPTVDSTWSNFMYGVRCVGTIPDNLCYALLYTLGFIMSYVGSAYLNYYSAATCAIISNLSSPLTALFLIAAPRLNVVDDARIPWCYNALAVILLSVAAVLYVLWEESTKVKKVEGERELKLYHVREMGDIQVE